MAHCAWGAPLNFPCVRDSETLKQIAGRREYTEVMGLWLWFRHVLVSFKLSDCLPRPSGNYPQTSQKHHSRLN